MVSNIYLKFSELAVLDKDEQPFSNTYGATSAAVLTEFLSLDDITYSSIEDLVAFVSAKGKNRFSDPYETTKLLQKAARDSYRLDAEIGTITSFGSHDALAKYAGLTWRVNQSGNYSADDTRMTKTGNKYLRYYLIEAANSVKKHIPEYRDFYKKKFGEVTTHQHKRALALTSRKLVRLIFGLLTKNQIYSSDKVGEIQ